VTLFKYLLIQSQMVHSPTHSPMTWTIDPSSPMVQSMCVHEVISQSNNNKAFLRTLECMFGVAEQKETG